MPTIPLESRGQGNGVAVGDGVRVGVTVGDEVAVGEAVGVAVSAEVTELAISEMNKAQNAPSHRTRCNRFVRFCFARAGATCIASITLPSRL